jgi:hypothetical protein
MAAENLRQPFDEAMTGPLIERCCVHTAGVVRREDSSVWRIRRLDLSVSLDSTRVRAGDAADVCGHELALSVAKVIQQDQESDAVLRFENYASFVVRFTLDLAANRAWGKWYYEEFEDLRIFPPSQTIRTVLLREAGLAADMIVQLASQQNLEAVLAVLTDHDAGLIFDSCFESHSAATADAGLDKWVTILLECCAESPLFPVLPGECFFRDALLLFSGAAVRAPGAAVDQHLRGAIVGLLELRRVLSLVRSPLVLESLIHKIADGEIDEAIDLATRSGLTNSAEALRFFADRMQGDADWGREAMAVLLNGNLPGRLVSAASIPKRESLLSPFAGVFLLGPSFLNLRCGQLADTAAHSCDEPSSVAPILRHLTAMKCFGRARALDTADDAAVCLFTGFAMPYFGTSLASLRQAQLDIDAVHAFHWQTLSESERISDRCVLADLVSCEGRKLFVLRDLMGNEWLDLLWLADEGANPAHLVPKRLARAFEALGLHPKLLLVGNSLASHVDRAIFRDFALDSVVVSSHEPTAMAQLGDSCGQPAARLQTLLSATEGELAYLSLRPVLPEIDGQVDDTFSLIARAVLRDFSRRLLAFDLSTPEYLYENFLGGTGSVVCRDEALEVRLPAIPLRVILRMAGLQQQTFQPPWLAGREVWLLPPQD